MNDKKPGRCYLDGLKQRFPHVVLEDEWQTDNQLTVTVKLDSLPDVVEWLYYQNDGWLSVLFGNDERSLNGHFAVYYVLSMEGAVKCWVVVRALVDPQRPEFPSVTPRVPERPPRSFDGSPFAYRSGITK